MTSNAANPNLVCTYDSKKKMLAWFDVSEGNITFIGYGSSAPDSALGYDQSDAPWFVTGVSLADKEAASA